MMLHFSISKEQVFALTLTKHAPRCSTDGVLVILENSLKTKRHQQKAIDASGMVFTAAFWSLLRKPSSTQKQERPSLSSLPVWLLPLQPCQTLRVFLPLLLVFDES